MEAVYVEGSPGTWVPAQGPYWSPVMVGIPVGLQKLALGQDWFGNNALQAKSAERKAK